MKRSVRAAAVIAVFLLPSVSFAADSPMKPGLWEITTKMEMPGVPYQIPPTKSTHCYTAEEIAKQQGAVPEQKGDCAVTDLKRSGNKTTWKVVCKGENPGQGEGEIVFQDPASYAGKMKFEAQGMTISSKYSGRRVGDCQ